MPGFVVKLEIFFADIAFDNAQLKLRIVIHVISLLILNFLSCFSKIWNKIRIQREIIMGCLFWKLFEWRSTTHISMQYLSPIFSKPLYVYIPYQNRSVFLFFRPSYSFSINWFYA